MYPLLFIDTETTGLSSTSTVIEIAMIRREEDGAETRFHTLIKPTEQELADAHPKALEVNGYAADPSRWDDAPSMSEAGPQIVAFAEGAKTLVGHNVAFDERMVMASFDRHGVEGRIPYHKIDTITLTYEHLTPLGLKRASLDTVRGFLGWPLEGGHTAMKDAGDCKKLFDLLWQMTPEQQTDLAMLLAGEREG